MRLGAQYKATEQVSFFADVSSQLAERGASFGGQAGLQVRW